MEEVEKLPKDHPDHWHQRRLTGEALTESRKKTQAERRDYWMAKYKEKIDKKKEFIKRREGEDFDTWSRRTRRVRAGLGMEVEPLKSERRKTERKKVRARIKKDKLKAKQPKTKVIDLYEREPNYLKYYPVFMNWASIYYDLPREVLEFSFALIDSSGFTKDNFLMTAKSFGFKRSGVIWKRLYERGYIAKHSKNEKEEQIHVLHRNYKKVLISLYKMMRMEKPRDKYVVKSNVIVPEDMIVVMREIAQKALDIQAGLSKPEYIELTT